MGSIHAHKWAFPVDVYCWEPASLRWVDGWMEANHFWGEIELFDCAEEYGRFIRIRFLLLLLLLPPHFPGWEKALSRKTGSEKKRRARPSSSNKTLCIISYRRHHHQYINVGMNPFSHSAPKRKRMMICSASTERSFILFLFLPEFTVARFTRRMNQMILSRRLLLRPPESLNSIPRKKSDRIYILS